MELPIWPRAWGLKLQQLLGQRPLAQVQALVKVLTQRPVLVWPQVPEHLHPHVQRPSRLEH
jgi:hypothetical protein